MTLNELFYELFSYKPTNNGFGIFSWQHILLLLFQVGIPVFLAILFSKKLNNHRDKILRITAITLIISYLVDFFLQPFYAGRIIPNKLPFHICTATGVLLAFVTLNKKCEKLSVIVTVWAILSPFLWMLLPFSTYDGGISLFCYPFLQSCLYHMLEFFWGIYMLLSGKVKLEWKSIWQPVVALLPMALWATFGQELYFPNEIGENFLMLRTDTTGICPHWVYLIALFIGAALAIAFIYLIYYGVSVVKSKKQQKEKRKE